VQGKSMDRTAELRKRLIKRTKQQVKESYSGKETHIIKAVNLLGDLDSVFNLLAEQLIEWYGVHFPELEKLLNDNETYLKLVYFVGARENFLEKNVSEQIKNNEKAKIVCEKAKDSMGAELTEKELSEIKLLALNALNLKEERVFLQKFIEEQMKQEMPNFSAICEPVIGAKLLAKAGSLKKLAIMPSSTIQVLGAEKALFQHLRQGGKPPKHGLIFRHTLVAQATREKKGKVARALAGKLSIAAKEDFFGKKQSTELEKKLNERIREIEKTPAKKKLIQKESTQKDQKKENTPHKKFFRKYSQKRSNKRKHKK
jgi:nucleolar protein 56